MDHNDIKFIKSIQVNNSDTNGGRIGTSEALLGRKNDIFPAIVDPQQLVDGCIFLRKLFIANHSTDEVAYNLKLSILTRTFGDDSIAITPGDWTDTAAEIPDDQAWMCAGRLNTSLTGGESSIDLLMESDDYVFPPGKYLYITNVIQTGQSLDDGSVIGRPEVRVGDYCTYRAADSKWGKASPNPEITHPLGFYIGGNEVVTYESGVTNSEIIQIKDTGEDNQVIGTGDGSDTSPTLSDLTITDPIFANPPYRPQVKTVCGGTERIVYINSDGTVDGYCSNTGTVIDLDTGVWSTPIDWTTAPDNAENITITYRETPFSYSGNTATVNLETTILNTYTNTNTVAAPCIESDEIRPEIYDLIITSSAGDYDDVTYPILLDNLGTTEDTYTVTFTSASEFTVTGFYSGLLGSGNITTDFTPTDSNGNDIFTIDKDGWSGTFVSGDEMEFSTHPSAYPFWLKQTVPSGSSAADNSPFLIRYAFAG